MAGSAGVAVWELNQLGPQYNCRLLHYWRATARTHLHALIPQLCKGSPDASQQLLPVLGTCSSLLHLLLEACAVPVQQAVEVQDLRLWQLVFVLERFWAQRTHQHMLFKLWADVLDGLQVPVTKARCQSLLCSTQ